MNPWPLLLGLLAYNYRRHILGRDTLCSTARRHLPFVALFLGWVALTGWILPHLWRGYPRP